MYMVGTITKINLLVSHLVVDVYEECTKATYHVKLAPTNAQLRLGDRLEYANGELMWTTMEAELAFKKSGKVGQGLRGRSAIIDCPLVIRGTPRR